MVWLWTLNKCLNIHKWMRQGHVCGLWILRMICCCFFFLNMRWPHSLLGAVAPHHWCSNSLQLAEWKMVKDYPGEAQGGFTLSVFLYFTQGREDETGHSTVSVPGQSTEVSTEKYLSIHVQGIKIRFFSFFWHAVCTNIWPFLSYVGPLNIHCLFYAVYSFIFLFRVCVEWFTCFIDFCWCINVIVSF